MAAKSSLLMASINFCAVSRKRSAGALQAMTPPQFPRVRVQRRERPPGLDGPGWGEFLGRLVQMYPESVSIAGRANRKRGTSRQTDPVACWRDGHGWPFAASLEQGETP